LRDRASDVALGKVFEDNVASVFKLPVIAGRSALFFRAVEIADLMFCLSMLEHDRVTRTYGAQAKRAAIAYLESYLPKRLKRLKQERRKR